MPVCGSGSLYMLYYYNILLAPGLLAPADHLCRAAFTKRGGGLLHVNSGPDLIWQAVENSIMNQEDALHKWV